MTIDFTCQKCDNSFELEAKDLIDGTEKVICPNCDAKAPASLVEDFASALGDLRTHTIALSKKFSVTLSLDSEDLDEVEADEEDAEGRDQDDEEEGEDEEDDDELDVDEDEDASDEDAEEA
jgi:hypothetical protein